MNRRNLIVTLSLAASCISPLCGLAAGGAPSGVTPAIVSPLVAGDLERARSMIREHNYSGALDQLRNIELRNLSDTQREEISFLIAHTAYMQGDESCVGMLEAFAADYPASNNTLTARLLAADYYFFNHDFNEALTRYNDINLSAIDKGQRKEYLFRKALSMIKCGYADEAVPLLKSLKDSRKFGLAADYYLAYIDYLHKDYDKAYKAFSALPAISSSNRSSRGAGRDYISDGIEPGYYMAQIEFFKEDYGKAISHARSLLEKRPVNELLPETLRILGESYFRTGDQYNAEHYLQRYLESTDSPSASAQYTLGTILYDKDDYPAAAELFSLVTSDDSDLAQSAWLYLGQCAVSENDNSGAAMAFERAYRTGYDNKISETGLYNYATALLRGGSVPFSSSAPLLEEFLRKFPSSEHSADVSATLAEAYCRQGDYAKALDYLDNIKNPSPKIRSLLQQVLFQLGVEEQSNNESAAAIGNLRRAATMTDDRNLAVQARLWLADALYSQKDFSDASKEYLEFIKAGKTTPNYSLGVYNLAYSLYQQNEFSKAIPYFTQAAEDSGLSANQRANARLRKADCLFYSRKFKEALDAYSRVISSGDPGADYASLRHATLLGLLGDVPGKLKELGELEKRYPASDWSASALLEQASTLYEQGNIDEAQRTYRKLSEQHPERPETRRGIISLANSLRAQNKTDEAIDYLQSVISQWPSSEEALLAHEDLSNLHASRGTLEQYAKWLGGIKGAPRMTVDEMEELEYRAAADAFSADINNLGLLREYAEKFPEGAHIAAVLYDLADGLNEAGEYNEALKYLDTLILRRPDATQADAALLMKADILEYHSGTSMAQQAYNTYKKLESRGNKNYALQALAGMMRTTRDASEQVALAKKILLSGGDTEMMEQATYYEADALIRSNKGSEAIPLLNTLAEQPLSTYGARGAILLAQYYYDRKEYPQAESVLNKFTDSGTPHEYWLARGFILLADVYAARGKKQLAREYLLSLRENYPGDEKDIREMIDNRISKLK